MTTLYVKAAVAVLKVIELPAYDTSLHQTLLGQDVTVSFDNFNSYKVIINAQSSFLYNPLPYSSDQLDNSGESNYYLLRATIVDAFLTPPPDYNSNWYGAYADQGGQATQPYFQYVPVGVRVWDPSRGDWTIDYAMRSFEFAPVVWTKVDLPDKPVVSITDAAPVQEGGTARFAVTATGVFSQPVTITVATAAGTAQAGSDFVAGTKTLVFSSAGTQYFDVATVADKVSEPEETFSARIMSAENATISRGAATGTITDAPTLTITDAGSVTEGDPQYPSAVFLVTLAGVLAAPVTVAYETKSGQAEAGSDFTAISGMLTFTSAGTKEIRIPIIKDAILGEPLERFSVILSAPSSVSVTKGVGYADIVNNDPPKTDGAILKDTASLVAYLGVFSDDLSRITTDPDHDTLSFKLLRAPDHGRVSLSENGVFAYARDSTFFGDKDASSIDDSFQYQVTDTNGHTDLGQINFVISPALFRKNAELKPLQDSLASLLKEQELLHAREKWDIGIVKLTSAAIADLNTVQALELGRGVLKGIGNSLPLGAVGNFIIDTVDRLAYTGPNSSSDIDTAVNTIKPINDAMMDLDKKLASSSSTSELAQWGAHARKDFSKLLNGYDYYQVGNDIYTLQVQKDHLSAKLADAQAELNRLPVVDESVAYLQNQIAQVEARWSPFL